MSTHSNDGFIELDPTMIAAVAGASGKLPGPAGKLKTAFEIGWNIGTIIDESTGASDKISDWLLDKFGPWG